ncbi:unnamed protein product [Orchesella dallaii]|uniref:Transmembrane protein n=1 Tax=Orchesella dallaii TaxID=48710 RepID=A0ABP1RP86_9HEXA
MMPFPLKQGAPCRIRRSKSSVLTPAIRKAVTLYKNSYGLLPPIIADIKLSENEIRLEIQKPTWFSVSYTLACGVFATVALLAMLTVLVKAYWFSLLAKLNTIQIGMFLSVEVGGWYLLKTAQGYLSNLEPIRHLNTLISNEASLKFQIFKHDIIYPEAVLISFMTLMVYGGIPFPFMGWLLGWSPVHILQYWVSQAVPGIVHYLTNT